MHIQCVCYCGKQKQSNEKYNGSEGTSSREGPLMLSIKISFTLPGEDIEPQKAPYSPSTGLQVCLGRMAKAETCSLSVA